MGGGRLILNTAFPRVLLPLSSVITAFMRFLPTMIVYVPVHFIAGLPVGPQLLWVFPVFVLFVVLAAGLAMLVAAAQVYFRDLKNFLPYVLRIWLYASPILYYAERGARALQVAARRQPAGAAADRVERRPRRRPRAERRATSRSAPPGRSRCSSPARCSSSPGSVSSLSVSDALRIRVEDVSVTYRTSLERAPTLKSTMLRLGRRERVVREIEALKDVSFEVAARQGARASSAPTAPASRR